MSFLRCGDLPYWTLSQFNSASYIQRELELQECKTRVARYCTKSTQPQWELEPQDCKPPALRNRRTQRHGASLLRNVESTDCARLQRDRETMQLCSVTRLTRRGSAAVQRVIDLTLRRVMDVVEMTRLRHTQRHSSRSG